MKIVLIDPVSSGGDLADAFRERGVETLHIYQKDLSTAFAADTAPGGTLLHESFAKTLATLKRADIHAVLPGSEAGVSLAEQLAAALGLPHNAMELASARRDKLQMAQALEKNGVPCARTEAVTDPGEVDTALGRFESYPVVVKPATSAGSDGLAICATEAEAREAVLALLGKPNLLGLRNDTVLVQEYLSGPQYTFNTVSVDGRHVISELLVLRFDEIEGVPVQRHQILRKDFDADDQAVADYGLRCLDALGVTNGAGHTEIRLTARGPLLVEVNSRLMGPVLPSDAYVSALGHSHATLLADGVLGTTGFTEYAERPYSPRHPMGCVFMRTRGAGVVRGLRGLDAVRRLPTFHSFARLPALGTEIKDPLLTTGNAGMAYFVGDTESVRSDIDQLHAWEDAGSLYTMSEAA